MPGLMHRSCRTVEAPVNPWSRAQAQVQADPRGLLHEAHRLVDRKDRPVSLVVPRLDVVNTETLRVPNGLELQGHRQALSTSLAPHAGESLPDERGILNRPLQVRHAEPTSFAVDRDEERVRQEARPIDPMLSPF